MAFAVVGNTGSFDDYTFWTVCVYFKEEIAQQHVDLANAWLKAHGLDTSYLGNKDIPSCPFDPELEVDHLTGTQYGIEEVSIHHKLQTFE